MTRTDQIRQMLDDGPVLVSDVVIELGCTPRVASATLRSMERRGELTSRPFRPGAALRGRNSAKLYERAPCRPGRPVNPQCAYTNGRNA